MRSVVAGALIAPILILGCSHNPGPAPATTSPADLLALQGEWVGSYQADVAHGRSGAMLFRLDAQAGVAQGCAIMRVAGRETAETIPWEGDLWSRVPPERLILVTFVAAEEGTVRGTFATYTDPVCGCEMRTELLGRLQGNLIEGTYVMEHLAGGERAQGTWRVVRRTGTDGVSP